MYVHHVPVVPGRPERASDSLGLKLLVVVSYHVGLEIKPGSSGRAASAFNHSAMSLAPNLSFKNKSVAVG